MSAAIAIDDHFTFHPHHQVKY